jgi:cystathionine beta-lyase/cystathionine gamma-synthase
MSKASGFFTRAIHGGASPDPSTGAILTPIFQSTTYVQDAVGKHKGYTYSRSGNPTVSALERRLGELESALPGVCFTTGMAAETALFLALLKAGDEVVISDVVYGGTVRLLQQILGPLGIRSHFVDTSDLERVEQSLTPKTRLVFLESPGNPTLKLTDIAAVAALTRTREILLAIDNTLMTPYLQRPLDLGADVVVHSTTKFIEGHNATVGGALLSRRADLIEKFRFVQNSVGMPQSPFEAWLTLQGLKTLPLRMERHSQNAFQIALFLETHPRVDTVTYPFLESFPQHALARRQQRLGGGLISFTLKGGVTEGIRVMNSVKLCALAENLGAVETLITHPASMTHADVPPDQRRAAGLADGLVRLSVGLEDPEDLIADLERALSEGGSK